MCKFLSAIVLKNGDALANPLIDSHESLMLLFGVKERTLGGAATNQHQAFVRVEYTPPIKDKKPDFFDFDNYVLRVDETETPEWFSDVREGVLKKLGGILNRMVVGDDEPLVAGRAVLIPTTAKLRHLVGGRVVAAQDKADLSRADLSGADLSGAYLSGAYLSGANLYGAIRPVNPPAGWVADENGILSRAK